ncbi:unnamed protein product [Toxocara canis]|uniref:CPG4 domain-containing protein n=1 Tax=Toxocara canis TaxID=6265 RepID=A0A183UXF0_TOXCA|nr:unnamed protein product [Toxocara canis]
MRQKAIRRISPHLFNASPGTASLRGETSVSPLDQEAMTSNKSIDATADMGTDMGKILAKDEKLLAIAGAGLPDCFKVLFFDCFIYSKDATIISSKRSMSLSNREITMSDSTMFASQFTILQSNSSYHTRFGYSRFIEARDCLEKLKHCGNYELFDVLTSGIKYMCIDQKDAFNATMECIDVNTSEIQDKCSKDCNVEGILAGWGVYAGLRQTALFAQQPGPAKVNVLFFRKLSSEGCQVLQCFLSCLRSKFNTRCHGMAGSLLSEVIFRPIAMGQDLMLLGPALNLVRLILPMQCNFVMTKAGISNFRYYVSMI